jgi:L-2-hydroxyglutarate oxidase LhgO
LDRVDCAVIGAGVVGLACARALARAGHQVLVLERAASAGTVTSSRNSGVIHAGIYYQPGTMRARLCAPGRRALYTYCNARGIAAPAYGKLIVATDEAEHAALHDLATRAAANGVEDLTWLTAAQAHALEPALHCTAALLSPSTGIIDAHAYMLALQGDAEEAGALFSFRSTLDTAEVTADGFILAIAGQRIGCAMLVNAAGLDACVVATRIGGLPARYIPKPYFAKGSYFELAGRAPFSRLIYPVPIPGGAGIHLTLDLGGQARFGPDVEAIETIDYTVDPARALLFAGAIRRYWPGLPENALRPGYAGIRPKIVAPTETQDFLIQDQAIHGVPGLINLFGIESPGLTASLAIADHVAALL